MTDDTIRSANFNLIRGQNAFGETFRLREKEYAHVLLIQPTNEWFLKQWDQSHTESNQRNLLYLLEAAYERGARAARTEIKKALGIP